MNLIGRTNRMGRVSLVILACSVAVSTVYADAPPGTLIDARLGHGRVRAKVEGPA